jgi:hypothetical protein
MSKMRSMILAAALVATAPTLALAADVGLSTSGAAGVATPSVEAPAAPATTAADVNANVGVKTDAGAVTHKATTHVKKHKKAISKDNASSAKAGASTTMAPATETPATSEPAN